MDLQFYLVYYICFELVSNWNVSITTFIHIRLPCECSAKILIKFNPKTSVKNFVVQPLCGEHDYRINDNVTAPRADLWPRLHVAHLSVWLFARLFARMQIILCALKVHYKAGPCKARPAGPKCHYSAMARPSSSATVLFGRVVSGRFLVQSKYSSHKGLYQRYFKSR